MKSHAWKFEVNTYGSSPLLTVHTLEVVNMKTQYGGEREEEEVEEEKCAVGWITVSAPGDDRSDVVEHQLVALTYTGGWYRLALPSSSSFGSQPSAVPPHLPSHPERHSSERSRTRTLSQERNSEVVCPPTPKIRVCTNVASIASRTTFWPTFLGR